MSKKLDDFFGLPPMDEDVIETPDIGDTLPETKVDLEQGLIPISDQMSIHHSEKMDEITTDTTKYAREIADLALDLDPARSPRMFEVAGQFYRIAMDSENSKRDAQLKLMKLLIEQRKLDLLAKKLSHDTGEKEIDVSKNVVMCEDRNTILKRLREEALERKADSEDKTDK